jgi:peptidoglycan/xylan/chitin deacetylase (PgdA/CDA1 family)
MKDSIFIKILLSVTVIVIVWLLIFGGVHGYILINNQFSQKNVLAKNNNSIKGVEGFRPTNTPLPTPTPVSTIVSTPIPIQAPSVTTTSNIEISKINTTNQIVVFTFDAGSGSNSFEKINTVLKNHNLKSTFFITGKWMEQNPQLLQKLVNNGHEVFNHTYTHSDLTTLTPTQIKEEFRKTENIMLSITGRSSKPYFRPPYGARNQFVWDAAASEGYQSIYWSLDALDWKPGITDAEVKSRVLSNVYPGAIYLMHVGDDITGNILDSLFTEIKSRGYTIVSLTDALN